MKESTFRHGENRDEGVQRIVGLEGFGDRARRVENGAQEEDRRSHEADEMGDVSQVEAK